LLFRLGDFYELFYEDAILASRELQITLTSRNREKGHPIPMCGVPYHSADGYIGTPDSPGFKVAICRSNGASRPWQKIIRRGSRPRHYPGHATDVAVLDAKENNFLASVFLDAAANTIGLAFVGPLDRRIPVHGIIWPAAERSASATNCNFSTHAKRSCLARTAF